MPHRLLTTLFFLVLFPLVGTSQILKTRTSVYFDTDKYKLRQEGKALLNSILDTLPPVDIIKVELFGNTDNRADSLYNLKLSKNRTEAVKNYLVSKGLDGQKISSNFFGEEKPIAPNNDEKSKQKNRRVDVIFYFKDIMAPTQAVVTVDSLPKEEQVVDTCHGDTIITLPQGSQVVFDKCEYLELKDCIEFTETNNPEDILANGMTLMDTAGFPIASCGMLRITLKAGCTERPCFKTPVKVRFPLPEDRECDFCGRNASVWGISSAGWSTSARRKDKVKIIKIDKKSYYQMVIDCPNEWKNCDCRPKGKLIKFKVKRNYQIVSMSLSNDCPTALAVPVVAKNRKNIAKTKLPCWKGNKMLTATITNKSGDTLVVRKPLNKLKKRIPFSRCVKIRGEYAEEKSLGIFTMARREFYRKYLVYPSDAITSEVGQN